jgi:DNA-binding MarR family transcriptional regulator
MEDKKFYEELTSTISSMHTKIVHKLSSVLIKGKLGFAQMVVIDVLRRDGELKMSDMAKILGVTKSAVTGITDRLIRDGFLTRERSDRDRRVVWMRLTKKGSFLSKKFYKNKLNFMRSIFSKISKKDKISYLKIIRKIKNNLKDK